jgi:hypothetical protein
MLAQDVAPRVIMERRRDLRHLDRDVPRVS